MFKMFHNSIYFIKKTDSSQKRVKLTKSLNMRSRSVAGNFTIQIIGRILAILIGLVSIGLLTRSLGVENFGAYTTALTFLQLFGVMVDFGLTLTLVVMISEPEADEQR